MNPSLPIDTTCAKLFVSIYEQGRIISNGNHHIRRVFGRYGQPF